VVGCGGQPGGAGGGDGGGAGGLIDLPRDDPDRAGPLGVGAFSLLLSADKTVLIRGDEKEGSARFSAVASHEASFKWTVDAPEGLVAMSTPADIATAKGVTGSEIDVTALGDPGSTGRVITVSVTATQVDGAETADDSVSITVVRPEGALAVSVATSRARIAPGETLALSARISGGEPLATSEDATCTGTGVNSPPDEDPAYLITWSFNDDALAIQEGVPDETEFSVACLEQGDEVTISRATYRAPVGEGTVVFNIEARDASGNRVTGAAAVTVAPATELTFAQAASNNINVAPGGSVELVAEAAGGEGPYDITFTASGTIAGASIVRISGGSAMTRDVQDGCSNIPQGEECLVRYSAPDDQEGGELVTVEIVDRLGSKAFATIPLILTSESGLQVVGVSDPIRVDPGGTADITAIISGGTPPYTVTFANSGGGTINGSGLSTVTGCGETALGVTGVRPASGTGGGATASADYAAPTEITSDVVTITVCDNVGNQATDSLALTISPEQSLVVSATATPSQVPPGAPVPVGIAVTAIGGTAPYSLVASVEPGGPGGTVTFPDPTFEETAHGTYTPPSDEDGTEVIKIVVTDSTGQTGTAFVNIGIQAEQLLDVTLSATESKLDQGDCTTLTASALGGVPPYSYEFSIETTPDPGCLFDPTLFDPTDPVDCPAAAPCDPTYNSSSSQAGYRAPHADTGNFVRVMVEDAVGNTAVDVRSLTIGSSEQLEVDVFANPSTVIVGDPAPPPPPFALQLGSAVIGAPVSYAWSQLGGPPGGTGVFEDETAANTTWYPGTVPGAYVLRLEVTDAVPQTAADTVTITVVAVMSGDISAAPGETVSVFQTVFLNLPVSGGVGLKAFDWNFDAVPGVSTLTDADFVAETSVPTSFAPDVVGTYNISCTVTDEGGNTYQPTIVITANEALAINPLVEVNSIDGVDCIVALPAMGEGEIDPNHVLATLNAHLSGGVAPYTFTWEVTESLLWGDPVLVDPVNGTAEWDIPSGVTSTLPVTFNLMVRDATLYEVNADVVVQLAPPVIVIDITPPEPRVGNVNVPFEINIFRSSSSGTAPVTFRISLVTAPAGGEDVVLDPDDFVPEDFEGFGRAWITGDTVGTYHFTVDFTDGCSDAVVSHPSTPFTVELTDP